MTARRWAIFLAICFAVFLALELWAYFSGAPTLSQTVWTATDWFAPLALIGCYAAGLLCGHFWWPRQEQK